MNATLELTQLGKSFDTPSGQAEIVKDVFLKVADGEFICIVGHSGCGKSTVLSMIMGLIKPTCGGVILNGREIDGPGLDRGVVFQSPSLFPWLTTAENVQLAADQAHGIKRKRERSRIAHDCLRLVGLEEESSRYPDELSAGMKQRAGIARAFAINPKVLLLDEPFSLLDALTRMELQDELIRICERERTTVVMVTHDVDEALLLADRIVMMTCGPAARIGEIVDVKFKRPRNRAELMECPEFFALRDRLTGFLESQAAPSH
jgi:nitrate/nitrite transport system ATP-binding protein